MQTQAQVNRVYRHRNNPTIAERIRALRNGGFISGQNGMMSSAEMSPDFVEAVFEEQQAFSKEYGRPELSRTGNVFGPVFGFFCGL